MTFLAPTSAQVKLLTDDIHRLVPADVFGALASGDLDGDGDLDLVYGGRLLVNDGRAYFADAACPAPSADAIAYASADLDADGDVDVVEGRDGADELWVNDGSGCFTPRALPLPTSFDWTIGITLTDVEGDGDLDIACANGWSDYCDPSEYCGAGNVRLFLNDGLGNFTDASAQIPEGDDEDPRSLAFGDVDADGDVDLLVDCRGHFGHYGSSRLLLNDGSGSFSDASDQIPPNSVSGSIAHFADLDGDGDLDSWQGGSILWLNDGRGRFTDASSTLPPLSSPAYWSDLADVDSDGDLDVLVASSSGEDSLLLNDGSATFTTAQGAVPHSGYTTVRVLLRDLDGDRDLDELAVRLAGLELALNDGELVFVLIAPLLPSSGRICSAYGIGDVDGDHDLDLLAAEQGQDELLLNAGDGSFAVSEGGLPTENGFGAAAQLVDVDGDGDLDALVAQGGDQGEPEALWLNDGSGRFTDASAQWSTPADSTAAMATGDVDLDGDADVLCGNRGDGDRLYFNDGTGVFTEQPGKWPASDDYTSDLALGDMDGDGDPDAVLIGLGMSCFENDGSGGFTVRVVVLFEGNQGADELALGDVDLDGDLDVLVALPWAPAGEPTLRLFTNDGAATFTDATANLPPTAEAVGDAVFGDLDGDLDHDILLFEAVQDQALELFVNDGHGVFSDQSDWLPSVNNGGQGIQIADTDGDGDLDALLAGGLAPSRLLVSLRRQLAWRSLPRIGEELTFDVWGARDKPFTLYGSLEQGYTPYGTWGVLRIARSQIFVLASGTLDPSGHATIAYQVPDDPSLLGTTLYWQVMSWSPRRLTNLESTTFLGL